MTSKADNPASIPSFRVRTEHSPDGFGTIPELVRRAVDCEVPALAVSDLRVMKGAAELQREALKSGIKPIFGLDLPVVLFDPNSYLDKARIFRDVLILIAEDQTGLHNLVRLSSQAAHLTQDTPLDSDQLAGVAGGLTVIVGSPGTRLFQLVADGQRALADLYLGLLRSVFGKEHVQVGLASTPQAGAGMNEAMATLAGKHNVPLTTGHQVLYPAPTDRGAWTALAAHRGQLEPSPFATFHLPDLRQGEDLFPHWPQVRANAAGLVERCKARFPEGELLWPRLDTGPNETEAEFLQRVAAEGLSKRYGDPVPAEATERLRIELEEITKRAFSSYFLILWDLLGYARENDLMAGPGRGSAPGSITCFALGITEVDPLEHDLLFERFLSPKPGSIPDVDLDFEVTSRPRLLRYLRDRYGSDRMLGITTASLIHPARAIEIAAREAGPGEWVAESVKPLLPGSHYGRWKPLGEMVAAGGELEGVYRSDPVVAEVLDIADRIQDRTRSQHTLAAATALLSTAAGTLVPTELPHESGDATFVPPRSPQPRTQFNRSSLEQIGVLTLDLLVLRVLDQIHHIVQQIRKNRDPHFTLESIPFDDESTLTLLGRGETGGIFLFGSDPAQAALRKLAPLQFDDLVATEAMNRPGANHLIDQYAEAKRDPSTITYLDERLRPILERTHGLFLYQEQLMRMAIDLAGFTPLDANNLREALGKKKQDDITRLTPLFFTGMQTNGISHEATETLWQQTLTASNWLFNRAHATAYAMISYRTAYLRAHFPEEFSTILAGC